MHFGRLAQGVGLPPEASPHVGRTSLGIRTHESLARHRLSKLAPTRLRLTRLPVQDSRLPLREFGAD